MPPEPYGPRIARWERATEWVMVGGGVAFLLAYSLQQLTPGGGIVAAVCGVVLAATWVAFGVDYIVRLVLARPRGRWFLRHLFDLATVIVPVLRPLRLLRLVVLLEVMHRSVGSRLRGTIIVYASGATVLLIWTAALAILDVESDGGGDIRTLSEAVWWAIVTVTTVGYGDYVPVTAAGRFIAVALMTGGIALIGVVTASLSSWILERVDAAGKGRAESARDEDQRELREGIAAARDEIRALRDEIRSLRGDEG
ncbi:two pore domain potassium channel family protein [Microbacterium sp. CBS5P-1]|nr:two pore domain potassium channel family protein [Microbacterium excoecariae]